MSETAPPAITFEESALSFRCQGATLLGVLSRPASAATKPGVLIIVGGPQYRAGSHRQFVVLARWLAAAGHPVLRFDYRGMGDSEGEIRNFDRVSDDIAAAIDAFQQQVPGLQRIVLWGLCDGASAALLYLHDRPDTRIAGLALLNPWVRSEASLAKTHVKHYYLDRLRRPEFWLKLLKGQVAFNAVRGLWNNLGMAFGGPRDTNSHTQAPYQERMARAWGRFRGPILLMLSEKDYTAREFVEFTRSAPAWQDGLKQHPAHTVELAGADHTCSQPAAQRAAEQATTNWLATWDHAA